MIVIGIDPGKSGGVAVISEDTLKLKNTPEEATGMADIISSALNSAYIENEKLTAYIENVHAFPTDARSSAFKFGKYMGLLLIDSILGYSGRNRNSWATDTFRYAQSNIDISSFYIKVS